MGKHLAFHSLQSETARDNGVGNGSGTANQLGQSLVSTGATSSQVLLPLDWHKQNLFPIYKMMVTAKLLPQIFCQLTEVRVAAMTELGIKSETISFLTNGGEIPSLLSVVTNLSSPGQQLNFLCAEENGNYAQRLLDFITRLVLKNIKSNGNLKSGKMHHV